MKKMMMMVVAIALATVTNVKAMSLDWSAYLIDNQTAGTEVAGYVELVWNGGVISSASGTGTILNSVTFYQNAIGSGTYNIPGGEQLYFRIYNATTIGAATEMITTSTFTMPTYSASNDNTAQNALNTAWATALDGGNGFIEQSDPRWVAVPEPTSMALLALGAAALGLRRKFRK